MLFVITHLDKTLIKWYKHRTMQKSNYDIIKRRNGEVFARALRDNNLLDSPDIVDLVKYAGHTPERELINYIRAFCMPNTPAEAALNPGDPFKLLHQAGYEFVEYADTLDKQNAIAKYFRDGEKLCTFRDPVRYQNYYIINAAKANADKISPAAQPERQDEYGTSVISIQMRKSGGFISIKNRYNHTVANPDNTFGSNPDNIILGLAAALRARFDVEWHMPETAVPDGYAMFGPHIIKYHNEVNNCYFGEYFYEKHGQIYEIDKNSQVLMDYMLLDLKTGRVTDLAGANDDFANAFNTATMGKKITVTGRAPNQTILVDGRPTIVLFNGQIKELYMPTLVNIGNDFLRYNHILDTLDLPNLTHVADNMLEHNTRVSNIDMPRLNVVGKNFLASTQNLTGVNVPQLCHAGNDFLRSAINVGHLNAANIITVGDYFLGNNQDLSHLDMPNLESAGQSFVFSNTKLRNANFPQLRHASHNFLYATEHISDFHAPKLQNVGNQFMFNNIGLRAISLPQVREIGCNFLYKNENISEIEIPQLEKVGSSFMYSNRELSLLLCPKLEFADDTFLYNNSKITDLYAPRLITIGNCFMHNNTTLTRVTLAKYLSRVGSHFLYMHPQSDKRVTSYRSISSDKLVNLSGGNVQKTLSQIVTHMWQSQR